MSLWINQSNCNTVNENILLLLNCSKVLKTNVLNLSQDYVESYTKTNFQFSYFTSQAMGSDKTFFFLSCKLHNFYCTVVGGRNLRDGKSKQIKLSTILLERSKW